MIDDEGNQQLSLEKSYRMSVIEERVGVKVNLEDNLYHDAAIQSYKSKGQRLMKYVKKDIEAEEKELEEVLSPTKQKSMSPTKQTTMRSKEDGLSPTKL